MDYLYKAWLPLLGGSIVVISINYLLYLFLIEVIAEFIRGKNNPTIKEIEWLKKHNENG